MKYTKQDFGSSYPDEKLYDTRVDYMQPAMIGIETNDHVERMLRAEIRNLEVDPAFYFEGEDVGDVIGLEVKGNESDMNKPKTTVQQALNANKDDALVAKAKASKEAAKAISAKLANIRTEANKARAAAQAATAKANAKKLAAEKAKEKRNAAFLKIKKAVPQMNGLDEDMADAAQKEVELAIADANASILEADKAIAYSAQVDEQVKAVANEEGQALSIAAKDASLAPAPKANKPLLIGAAAGIAALLYFNK